MRWLLGALLWEVWKHIYQWKATAQVSQQITSSDTLLLIYLLYDQWPLHFPDIVRAIKFPYATILWVIGGHILIFSLSHITNNTLCILGKLQDIEFLAYVIQIDIIEQWKEIGSYDHKGRKTNITTNEWQDFSTEKPLSSRDGFLKLMMFQKIWLSSK